MGATLIREQYKIIRTVESGDGYAVREAVDIQARERGTYLLNSYRGVWRKPYLALFDRLTACEAYREMFLEDEELVLVFDCADGLPLGRYCQGLPRSDWARRRQWMEQLMEQVLRLSSLPPEVVCGVLQEDNVCVHPEEQRIVLRYVLRPVAAAAEREAVCLAAAQMKRVLAPHWGAPPAHLAYVDQLENQLPETLVQLYSQWRSQLPLLEADYERLTKKNCIQRWIWLLGSRLRRRWDRRRYR